MRRLLLIMMLSLMAVSCELFKLELQQQMIEAEERVHLQETSEFVLQMHY